jgi:MOSC domain-containing protein YiiM
MLAEPRPTATIISVQIGVPTRLEDRRGRWKTSFVREPSPERRRLFVTHLEGNAQADTENHGQPGQAVLVYAAAHYPAWQEELGRPEIGPGGFGENFTVDGLTEETVCIGDTFAAGDALIQVTGPRYPCAKISRRWGIKGLTVRVAETGRTGWYCRVLREGSVEPGIPMTLIDRPHPDITIALINDFGHRRNSDIAAAERAATCPLLPEWWQRRVVVRARGGDW